MIGLTPSYGYGYFDPYCGISFRHLGAYYDHCHGHGHSEVILVVDARGGYPIATCVHRDGSWVVDDGYDDRYDDRSDGQYEDQHDDQYESRDDDGYDDGYGDSH